MLQKLDSPDTVLAVEVVGKLGKDDYQDRPDSGAQRPLLDRPGEIRCVFVFGDEFTGLTVGGTVEDTKLSFGPSSCTATCPSGSGAPS